MALRACIGVVRWVWLLSDTPPDSSPLLSIVSPLPLPTHNGYSWDHLYSKTPSTIWWRSSDGNKTTVCDGGCVAGPTLLAVGGECALCSSPHVVCFSRSVSALAKTVDVNELCVCVCVSTFSKKTWT